MRAIYKFIKLVSSTCDKTVHQERNENCTQCTRMRVVIDFNDFKLHDRVFNLREQLERCFFLMLCSCKYLTKAALFLKSFTPD